MRALVGLIVIAQAGVAALWWRRAGGAESWADLCVLAMMILAGSTRSRSCGRPSLFAGSWWASLALAPASSRSPRSAC